MHKAVHPDIRAPCLPAYHYKWYYRHNYEYQTSTLWNEYIRPDFSCRWEIFSGPVQGCRRYLAAYHYKWYYRHNYEYQTSTLWNEYIRPDFSCRWEIFSGPVQGCRRYLAA